MKAYTVYHDENGYHIQEINTEHARQISDSTFLYIGCCWNNDLYLTREAAEMDIHKMYPKSYRLKEIQSM